MSKIEADQPGLFSLLRQARIDVALTYDLNLPRDLKFLPVLELPPLVAPCETHLPAISIDALAPHSKVLLDLPHSSDHLLSFFAVRHACLAKMLADRDPGLPPGQQPEYRFSPRAFQRFLPFVKKPAPQQGVAGVPGDGKPCENYGLAQQ